MDPLKRPTDHAVAIDYTRGTRKRARQESPLDSRVMAARWHLALSNGACPGGHAQRTSAITYLRRHDPHPHISRTVMPPRVAVVAARTLRPAPAPSTSALPDHFEGTLVDDYTTLRIKLNQDGQPVLKKLVKSREVEKHIIDILNEATKRGQKRNYEEIASTINATLSDGLHCRITPMILQSYIVYKSRDRAPTPVPPAAAAAPPPRKLRRPAPPPSATPAAAAAPPRALVPASAPKDTATTPLKNTVVWNGLTISVDKMQVLTKNKPDFSLSVLENLITNKQTFEKVLGYMNRFQKGDLGIDWPRSWDRAALKINEELKADLEFRVTGAMLKAHVNTASYRLWRDR